jgi:hypothetical protein
VLQHHRRDDHPRAEATELLKLKISDAKPTTTKLESK